MARVKKIMLTDVPALEKEDTIESAVALLSKNHKGCVVIVENKKPVGIVTELDIVRYILLKGEKLSEPIRKIMTSKITFMTPDMKLDEALKIIDTKQFRRYPVIENEELVGIITKKDVIHYISEDVRFHRNIQNFVVVIFLLFEVFVFFFSKYFAFLLQF